MVHKTIPHTFHFQRLSYSSKPNKQRMTLFSVTSERTLISEPAYLKLTFYFNKLPHVSHEHFFRHWETVHADLTVACKDFGICGLKRYVQVRASCQTTFVQIFDQCNDLQFSQTPETKEKARTLPGVEVLDFDGCSEIWVQSWEDWERFANVSDHSPIERYLLQVNSPSPRSVELI